jgi:NTP pyrophosphatase (non-canonical NTP hydrolase)
MAQVITTGNRVENVRDEVARFAILMERELRKNDHKRSWKLARVWDMFRRLQGETSELHRELTGGKENRRPARVAKEAADVANFAMFIADLCGGLEPK